MNLSKVKTFSFAIFALVLTTVLATPSAFASNAWLNQSGDAYHWARTTSSFNLPVVNNLSRDWNFARDGAISDWNQSTVVDFVVINAKRNTPCLMESGKVMVCDSDYGLNGWLGLTSINITGSEHITQALVQMNNSYFVQPRYDTTAQRNATMCHELGHTLGLGHADEDFTTALGTCTDYANDPTANQHPSLEDYTLLETIYGHLDSFDSYANDSVSGGTGGGGKGGGKGNKQAAGYVIDPNNSATWGEMVSENAKHNHSTFVKKEADGSVTITTVTWANKHAHVH